MVYIYSNLKGFAIARFVIARGGDCQCKGMACTRWTTWCANQKKVRLAARREGSDDRGGLGNCQSYLSRRCGMSTRRGYQDKKYREALDLSNRIWFGDTTDIVNGPLTALAQLKAVWRSLTSTNINPRAVGLTENGPQGYLEFVSQKRDTTIIQPPWSYVLDSILSTFCARFHLRSVLDLASWFLYSKYSIR